MWSTLSIVVVKGQADEDEKRDWSEFESCTGMSEVHGPYLWTRGYDFDKTYLHNAILLTLLIVGDGPTPLGLTGAEPYSIPSSSTLRGAMGGYIRVQTLSFRKIYTIKMI